MIEEGARQASGTVSESEAETETGSGGDALLEVVPETQPVLASPDIARGINLTRQESKKGKASSGAQKATIDTEVQDEAG